MKKQLLSSDKTFLEFMGICGMLGSFFFSMIDAGFAGILFLIGFFFIIASRNEGKITIYGNDLSKEVN